MKKTPFDRKEHVYRNDMLVELVKDAVRFFNGTPVHTLPPPEKFTGTGVYAIYYTGDNPHYLRYAELNRLAYAVPIYVGKAVPRGWRQARLADDPLNQSLELYSRLRQHAASIALTSDLKLEHFSCRFIIVEHGASDMIGTVEAALIKINMPLWNTVVDGFGNHDPGKGRYEQARSDWDIIHPGRKWALKCKGIPKAGHQILDNIERYMKALPSIL